MDWFLRGLVDLEDAFGDVPVRRLAEAGLADEPGADGLEVAVERGGLHLPARPDLGRQRLLGHGDVAQVAVSVAYPALVAAHRPGETRDRGTPPGDVAGLGAEAGAGPDEPGKTTDGIFLGHGATTPRSEESDRVPHHERSVPTHRDVGPGRGQ